MAVGTLVAVGVRVAVLVGLGVLVAVAVLVGLGVAVSVAVGVLVGSGVAVSVGVLVGLGVAVSVAVGVLVGSGVAVSVGVLVGLGVAVSVAVTVGGTITNAAASLLTVLPLLSTVCTVTVYSPASLKDVASDHLPLLSTSASPAFSLLTKTETVEFGSPSPRKVNAPVTISFCKPLVSILGGVIGNGVLVAVFVAVAVLVGV